MEILIAVFVAFILYKLQFSRNAKAKNRDAILGAAVGFGVPRDKAINILDTQMDKLSTMLHLTSMKESVIKHKPSYERMAHCIHSLYKKQQVSAVEEDINDTFPESTTKHDNANKKELDLDLKKGCGGTKKDKYHNIFAKIKEISEKSSLKYYQMTINSRHDRWGHWGYNEIFYLSNDEVDEIYVLVEEYQNVFGDSTLLVQVTNRPLLKIAESFNNEHGSITSTGFTIKDKETGHILAAKLHEGIFLGKVLIPEQSLVLDISPWKEFEYPFQDDFCYGGFEEGFNSNGNWWFCIKTEIPFSEIANLAVSLSKNEGKG
ncbi:hypothetical protein CTM88_16320 [Photobacterium aquimaris]|uniref:Uncharacterized protein n=1 Tax=Photobacterium aquimaris TaxID=512643 RepID=A0A2T3IGT8_9GAMM|nr:hypothetical protein [Photobacterium aquimaris]OBU16810.1 hypothetical protein AYY20_19355 [Photobacterium aquimaris]PSU26364.1 hypothetical protein CTM88_16320 [Photobacterium aquimaris]